MKEWEDITVANRPAIKYQLHYEGSPYTETLIVVDGKIYAIHFKYAGDSANKKYLADYEALLESFKFLN